MILVDIGLLFKEVIDFYSFEWICGGGGNDGGGCSVLTLESSFLTCSRIQSSLKSIILSIKSAWLFFDYLGLFKFAITGKELAFEVN